MKRLLFLIISVLMIFCSFAWGATEYYIDTTEPIVLKEIGSSATYYSEEKGLSFLLKTGQTTSYQADDDGDLELGIARNYTVLTTGQYAGNVTVTINSKSYDFLNACVKDNKTNKMWVRTVPQSDIGPATDGKLFWDQYTISAETCTCNATNKTITADAGTPFDTGALCAGRIFAITGSAAGNNGTFTVASITTSVITVSEVVTDEASIALNFATTDDLVWDLVDQANANTLAGYSDWRIPNRTELISIVDLGNCSPSINTTTFPSTPTDYFWSSSSYQCNTTNVLTITFYSGNDGYKNKYTNKYHVRLVRN